MSVNDGRKPHRNREPWPSDRVPTNDLQRLIASAPLNEDAASGFREGRNAQPESAPASTAASEPVFAWLATDLDGRGDVGLTKEEAKRRAGEGCTIFIPLYDTAASEQQASVSEAQTLDILESCARWLAGRAKTRWAEEFEHSDLMVHYADRLLEIRAALSGRATIPSEADERADGTLPPLPDPASNWFGFPFPNTVYFTKPQMIQAMRDVEARALTHRATTATPDLLAEILALAEYGMCQGLTADDFCNQIVDKIKAATAPKCRGCDPAEGFCRDCREAERTHLAATPDTATTAADQQGTTASAELLAAADAVVERWHSRDWKQPHTRDFIERLAAAVGAAKFQQGAAQPPQSDPKRDPKSPQSEGAAQAQAAGECAECDGKGFHRDSDENPTSEHECDQCQGTGRAAMAAPATSNGSK